MRIDSLKGLGPSRTRILDRAFAAAATTICVLLLFLFLLSWLITAAWPELAMRSLLSSEGIRWLFGQLPASMSDSGVVPLLMVCAAIGSLRKSGLASGFRHIRHADYRSRMAMRFVAAEFILMIIGLLFLTIIPHAILLSVSGEIFPSGFSRNMVPTLSLAVCLLSLTYGLACGRLRTATDYFQMAYIGIAGFAPIILLYLLGITLYHSVCFVLMW